MYSCRYFAKKIFLHQYIDTPTRARGMSIPHLLDFVISDEEFIENIDFQAPLGKSDHSVLLISCNVNPSANCLPKNTHSQREIILDYEIVCSQYPGKTYC